MADPIRLAAALDAYEKQADQFANMFADDNGGAMPMAPSIVGNMTPYEALRLGRFNAPLNRESIGIGPFSGMGVFSPQTQDPGVSPEAEWRQKVMGVNLAGEGYSLGTNLVGKSMMPKDQMARSYSAGAGPFSAMYAPVDTPFGKGGVKGGGVDFGPLSVQAIRSSMPMQKPTTAYEARGKFGDLTLQGAVEPRGAAMLGAEMPLGDGTLSFAGSRGAKREGDRDYNAMLRYNLRF